MPDEYEMRGESRTPGEYSGLGLSILYPENWTLGEDGASSAITLESPDGALMTVTKLEDPNDLRSPIEQAKKAMELEYDLAEEEPIEKRFDDIHLEGVTQRFVYLDLIVTSHLLTFKRRGIVYLIQMQGEDRDMERLEQVFDAILVSLCRPVLGSDND